MSDLFYACNTKVSKLACCRVMRPPLESSIHTRLTFETGIIYSHWFGVSSVLPADRESLVVYSFSWIIYCRAVRLRTWSQVSGSVPVCASPLVVKRAFPPHLKPRAAPCRILYTCSFGSFGMLLFCPQGLDSIHLLLIGLFLYPFFFFLCKHSCFMASLVCSDNCNVTEVRHDVGLICCLWRIVVNWWLL